MKVMKETNWKRSRMLYVAYRKSKRGLHKIHKRLNGTYYRLEGAYKRYTKAKSQAENTLEDISQAKKLQNAYLDFRDAKREHDTSRAAFSAAMREFREKEIAYTLNIFRVLQGKFGLNIVALAEVFGIWNATISRWLKSDPRGDFTEMYDEEYGADAEDEPDDETEI